MNSQQVKIEARHRVEIRKRQESRRAMKAFDFGVGFSDVEAARRHVEARRKFIESVRRARLYQMDVMTIEEFLSPVDEIQPISDLSD